MIFDLSRFAADEQKSRRANYSENRHHLQDEFTRDIDRIIHSRAFRRMYNKTQIFVAGDDDHARTRLTHTIEVSRIAHSISAALNLNKELTEAIALGHDIGHTPFGHIGERTLHDIMTERIPISTLPTPFSSLYFNNRGFKHNLQSIHIVLNLDKSMNLTKQTLWGMLNHSSITYKNSGKKPRENLSFYYYERQDQFHEYTIMHYSIEGFVVSFADEIAQRQHDLQDGIEYKILDTNVIRQIFCEKRLKKPLNKILRYYSHKIPSQLLANFQNNMMDIIQSIITAEDDHEYYVWLSKYLINILSTDLIYNIYINLSNKKSQRLPKYKNLKKLINYSPYIKVLDRHLQNYLFSRIITSREAQIMDTKGQYVIRKIFESYVHNPLQLPNNTLNTLCKELGIHQKSSRQERAIVSSILSHVSDGKEYIYNQERITTRLFYNKLMRVITNYVAGMTDNYALSTHKKLYNLKD